MQTELRVATGKRIGLVFAMAALYKLLSLPPCGTNNNLDFYTAIRSITILADTCPCRQALTATPPAGIGYPILLWAAK